MQTLTSSSRSITLEYYVDDGFKQQITENYAKNRGLSGRLWVDTFNMITGWTIQFDILTAAQWADLQAVFNDQLANNEFLTFNDADLSITNIPVWLSLPSERNIKWAKTVVEGVTITLERRDAVSQL